MTEANRNFSKLAKKVDEEKYVIIMKNNKPSYVMMDYEEYESSFSAASRISERQSYYGNDVIDDSVENVSPEGNVKIPSKIISRLNVMKTGSITFVEEKDRILLENTSIYALKKFQKEMEGKAKAAGLNSPDDVKNLIKEIRKEMWEEFYEDND